jgi:hypothetical protein
VSSRALRLHVVLVTLLVFVVLWAVVAARPWASTGRSALDPRLAALERRQHRLAREARLVKRELDQRWNAYRQRLQRREAQIRTLERRHAAQLAAAAAAGAAATYTGVAGEASGARVVTLPPQVRVVTLPPASSPATSSGSSHP